MNRSQNTGNDVGSIPLGPGLEPIPGYRLLLRLGAGGFGEVWRAEAPGGFHVALKFVRLDPDDRGGRAQAGITELRALEIIKAIRHPNLLATFGAWQTPDFLIIAMELADCTLWDSFQAALAKGRPGIPREQLLEYLSDAAKGIDHLNEHQHTVEGKQRVGIQHRDIKPQNILLLGGGVKVADFGLARLLESTQTRHTGQMTLAYAAPEFFDGQTSSQSDQYSLAVTYCELRTGRLPFTGSVVQIMTGHRSLNPNLEMLPSEERPIVARALAKKPADRWPSCRAFLDALRAARPADLPRMGSNPPGSSQVGIPTLVPWPTTQVDLGVAEEPHTERHSPTHCDEQRAPQRSGADRQSRVGRNLLAGAAISLVLASAVLVAVLLLKRDRNPEADAAPRVEPPVGVLKLANPGRVVVRAGQTSWFAVRLERTDVDGPVEVTFPRPPAGVTLGALSIPAGENEAQAVVSADRSAAVGEQSIEILAQSGPIAARGQFLLALTRAPELGLSVPALLRLRAGEKRTFRVQLTCEGIDEPVRVRLEDLPPAITAPEVTVPAGKKQAELTITCGDAIPRSERLVRVVGTAGTVRAETSMTLALDKAPNFRLMIVPSTLDLRAGKSQPFTIQVSRDGFDDPVAVRFGSLPSHVQIPSIVIPAGADHAPATAAVSDKADEGNWSIEAIGSGSPVKTEVRTIAQVHITSAPLHRRRGKGYFNAGQYPEAISEFTEVLRLEPEDVEAHFDRGHAYLNHGDLDKAVSEYDETLRLSPRYANAYNNRGVAHLRKNQYDAALADFSSALKYKPESALAWRNRGDTYEKKGDLGRALADYDQAERLAPRDAILFNNRGAVYLRKNEYSRAISDFDRALELDSRFVNAHSNRGFAYSCRREYEKALVDLNAALALDSKHALSYYRRGLVHAGQKDWDSALADYHQALRLNPRDAAAYYSRGDAYQGKKQYADAIAAYSEAIALSPRYTVAYNNRGNAYFYQKDYDKALADYTEAIRISPKYTLAYRNRGNTYRIAGQLEKALPDLNKALELDPHYADAANVRGLVYAAQGNYNGAIGDFTLAIRQEPGKALYYRNRADAYARRGDADKAREDRETAERLDPKK
jgi:tetratricopeptide (TPR) repeat protein/serine/threonine protein kinase